MQFAEAFEEAVRLMNDIDIVVNNAGILDERRWEREIAVNIVSDYETIFFFSFFRNYFNFACPRRCHVSQLIF